MSEIFIGSDNVVTLTGLYDIILADYENAATVVMSLFREPALSVNDAAVAVSEVHRLQLNTHATAGVWTLTYDGQTTANIQWNANLAAIDAAIELLANVAVGDVAVTGNSLDTDPVGNGLIITWKNTLGDVDLMSFDVSGLTGPTQAGTIMIEETKGVLLGVAVDEGGGKVGIPVKGHNLVAGDRVRLANTRNYNTEYLLTDVTNDKVIFTEGYTAETFNGKEKVYLGVPGGCNIAMGYIAASDGIYRGQLPDGMEGVIERSWYYLYFLVLL